MKSMIELNESLNELIKELNEDIDKLHEENRELMKKKHELYTKIQKSVEYVVINMHCKNKYELLKILIGD